MKLDPGFINHWKTERLIADLGADGVVAVLRLWGNAQIRREFSGLKFTPRRLAMETKWKGDENHLFSVLTDSDAPWLDPEEGGTWAIHGFSEHQHQIVKLWDNGWKGGRPKKEKPPTPTKEESSSSPCSSSSSYPIHEPNGNQMVSAKPKDEPASQPDLPEVASSGRRFPDHAAIITTINALRPEWARPSHWSAAELHAFHDACSGLYELTPQDWELLKSYLAATVDKAAGYWQPRNRSKFLETFPDVFASAQRWAGKTGHSEKPPMKEGIWK